MSAHTSLSAGETIPVASHEHTFATPGKSRHHKKVPPVIPLGHFRIDRTETAWHNYCVTCRRSQKEFNNPPTEARDMTKFTFSLLLFCLGSIAQAQFLVYREFFFSGQPAASYFDNLGFKRSDGIYQGEVTTGGVVVESKMRSTARAAALLPLYENRVWYDIEYLDTRAQYVGDATAHANAASLAQFIGWAKSEQPTLQIGIYEMVPVTDLWMAGRLSTTQHWNDQLQVLADALDFICPSVYLYYSESTMAFSYYAYPLVTGSKAPGEREKSFCLCRSRLSSGRRPRQPVRDKVAFLNVLNTIKNSGADGMIIFAGNGAMGSQYGDWARADTSGWWRRPRISCNRSLRRLSHRHQQYRPR